MKTVLRLGQNWPILQNISTTSKPVFTDVSAFVDVYTDYKTDISFAIVQGTLLW